MKDAENMRNRVDLLNQVAPYVGTYFSKEYVRRQILRMDDDDIEQVEKQIEAEVEEMARDQQVQQAQAQDQQGGEPQPSADLAAALSRETNQ